ncbi:MAG: hypothetical protein KGI97_05435, partial [Alphaproteobacteria bacterium]|nr:hypothetical protein [Alphaproteobacteria bacterium]
SVQQIYNHFAQKFGTSDNAIQVANAADDMTYAKAKTAAATAGAISGLPTAKDVFASLSTSRYGTSSEGTPASVGLRGTMGASGIDLSGSSTLFAALVLGQMNVAGATSSTDAFASGDKKNAVNSLFAPIA